MKETIRLLREGWYGNYDEFDFSHPSRKEPVSCRKLWNKCLEIAGTKFVQLCEGVSGQIGALVVDDTYEPGTYTIPIDTLVSYMVNDDADEGFFEGDIEESGRLVVEAGGSD